jgi:hypothetical protein
MGIHGPEITPKAGGARYCPGRDFVHMYPAMIKCMTRCFNKELWPDITAAAVDGLRGVTEVDVPEATLGTAAWQAICEANDVYWEFLQACTDNADESVADVLERVGWLAVPRAGRQAYLAMMGQMMTGQLFAGLRDIVPDVEKPDLYVEALRIYREQARRYMNGTNNQDDAKTFLKEALGELARAGVPRDQVVDLVKNMQAGLI